MRNRFACLGCAVMLVAGCHSATGEKTPYPKDPLLLSKKPMEGNYPAINAPAPPQLASAEPVQPQVPATALAGATAPPAGITSVPRPYNGFASGVPAQPMATIKAPVPAIPAVRTSNASPIGDGTFGHAPDHHWLQGILDKHYQGHLSLRYCDHSVEDSWGGKVRLEDDPRLAQFQDGDVVRVEGTLVPKSDQAPQEAWSHYPRYRIQSVELVRRKN